MQRYRLNGGPPHAGNVLIGYDVDGHGNAHARFCAGSRGVGFDLRVRIIDGLHLDQPALTLLGQGRDGDAVADGGAGNVAHHVDVDGCRHLDAAFAGLSLLAVFVHALDLRAVSIAAARHAGQLGAALDAALSQLVGAGRGRFIV